MKTLLFSFLVLGSLNFAFSQAPCLTGIGAGTNIGAGDCEQCVGANNTDFDFSERATAKVVLELSETLPCIPRLISITNEFGVTLLADCGVGQITQGGGSKKTLVEYCFWGDDEFFKARVYLSARIKYECSNI